MLQRYCFKMDVRDGTLFHRPLSRQSLCCPKRPRATSAQRSEESTAALRKVLILYSKPNCPLCEGMRDRVQGLIDRAQFMPSLLSEYTMEVRDITTDPSWNAAYDMEVPVLSTLSADGREVRLPRPPPRMTTDKLRQHIEAALLQ